MPGGGKPIGKVPPSTTSTSSASSMGSLVYPKLTNNPTALGWAGNHGKDLFIVERPSFNGRTIEMPVEKVERQSLVQEREVDPWTKMGQQWMKAMMAPLTAGSFPHSSQEAADAAMTASLVKRPDGSTYQFDGAWLTMAGLRGFKLSAAAAFFTARHLGPNGRMLIVHPSDSDPSMNQLRPAETVDGKPVPPSLQGKILEIGNPRYDSVGFTVSAEVMVKFLDAIRQSPLLSHLNMVDGQNLRATLFSSGALAGLLARAVMHHNGFDRLFERLDTLGAPFGGPLGLKNIFAPYFASMAYAWGLSNGVATGDLSSGNQRLSQFFGQLVDLSIAGKINLFSYLGTGNANWGEMMNGWTAAMWGGSPRSDGMVAVEDALIGRNQHVVSSPAGHRALFSDFEVFREYLEILAGTRTPSETAG
jgi:hypothetical protein